MSGWGALVLKRSKLFFSETRNHRSQGQELAVAKSSLPTFHIERQFAASLLGPIDNSLEELIARLEQYRERLPLSDDDRAAIAAAADAVRVASTSVQVLLAKRRAAGFD
jgi:hypothetical protein